MAKSCGRAGKVLQVDLSNEIVKKVPTADYKPEEFIGGVGLSIQSRSLKVNKKGGGDATSS